MFTLEEDQVLDCRGQLCPMPMVRVGREMSRLQAGKVLKVLATDRGAVVDIPAWANDTGNVFLEWHEEDGHIVLYVQRGQGTSEEDG